MPYRIDLDNPPDDAVARLSDLGALDIDQTPTGLAAIMPDAVPVERVSEAVGVDHLATSNALGRDDGSVWILRPRPVQIGRLLVLPPDAEAPADALTVRLGDSDVFGTGLHPTTSLCLEILDDELSMHVPSSMLDIGVGSGILALAALTLGVEHAVGIDIDPDAIRVAGENAHRNGLADRLRLESCGPEQLDGTWPLVFANVLAAPLLDLAPAVVRRIGHRGRLVLSGIPWALTTDVERTYQDLGMRAVRSESRGGWSAVIVDASW